MHPDNPFYGLRPISVYTTDQAIEDGYLIQPHPKDWPWMLITSGVHEACKAASEFDGRTYQQCLIPLLVDCAMQVRRLMEENPGGVSFAKLEHTVAGTVFIKPNDKGGMTVMLPEED